MIKKIFKNLAVFLMVGVMLLSNLPYRALSIALDSYIEASNIVDKAWNLSQDENVVDKFTSYRNLVEKFKIKEAHAVALTYVGGASGTGTGATYSVSLTALTGGAASAAAADDLVIVVTGWSSAANGDPGVSTPTGYTEVYDVYKSDTRDANMSVNWKVMGGTPDTSVTVRGFNNAANGGATVVQVWRGVDTTTPMDVTPPAYASALNAAHPNSPSITPVTSGAYVLTVGLGTGDTTPLAHTVPTGYNNTVSAAGAGTTMSTISDIASKAWTSGAEDPGAWTGGDIDTSSDSWTAGTLALRPLIVTTISNFVTGEPSNSTIAPGASGLVDSFGLQNDTNTDTVTGATVTLASGTGARVTTVAITNDGDTVTYCSATPSGDTATLTTCGIPVTTTNVQFKVKITAISHASMPVPPGAEYAVTATVTSFTSTYSQAGTDSGSATVTIDNASPNGATAVSGSAGDTNVTVNWTTSNSADFNTTSGSVIYRWTGASAGSEVPAEGSTATIGGVNGTATTACVVSSAASTALSRTDGTGGSADCTTTALTNGLQYTYKAFQKDTNGNYDVGVLIGTFTPVSASPNITVGTEGTQASPLIIPSTSNNVGGAFAFVRNSGTANVTQIIVTDNGTVTANLNLANVVLFYKTEATCSTSIPVDATQYNATPVSFAATEKATVTGTMTVGTSQICVYVRLDVGSGATDGQNMEIRVANPSTEVSVSAGTVSPSTAVDISGTTTLEVPKITVATEGTQANMIIGVGDNNVGGAFSFTRNTASANVTQIIVTDDTGTVNANANISDVRVYYKQEATCSTSIPVDATLFNSTAGTFNVSEKSTVTGTMTVGTSKICVYVRVDVGDGATNAQTLEIQIANPSTEVTVSAGSVAPATAVAIAGTTTLNLPTYTSQGIPFLYTANNWGTGGSGVSFFLEVYMRQTIGTTYARLLNETDGTAVTSSTLSTTSSTFTRVRSVALTLTDGKTYRVQFGKIGADAGETLGAKLVVNQNGGGGADLAEYYSSAEQLDLAEVVAIDASGSASVKRTDKQYQSNMLGVVATQPGIILGENVGQSYPIALVGRVPVRVTLENGKIKTGDFLTSSTTPGYAMKATKAGRVLGQVLEALDPEKLRDCPNGGQRTCGTVMVFVNLIDYLGVPVELVMASHYAEASRDKGLSEIPNSGLISTTAQVSTPSMLDELPENKQKILAFLKELKDSQDQGGVSEVFTDRVSATHEVISPQIITDILYAKKIKADSIEGLEILTNKISSLQGQIAGLSTSYQEATPPSSQEIATSSAALTPRNDIEFESGKFTLDLTVLGKLEMQGGLIVGGLAEFKNDTIFNSLAQFISKVIFKDNVLFEGRPTFNKDTAGVAVIKKDADNVEVIFEKEYAAAPIVSANMTFDPVKLADGNTEDPKILQKRISEQGYSYFVINRSTRGFTVVLNKPSSEDLTFSWTALSVKDAKRFESKSEPTPTPSAVSASASPTPSPNPSATPSVTPVATSSAALH